VSFDDLHPASFSEEESADLRRAYIRHTIRLVLVFSLLFAFVFFALSWSGAAVGYGARRAGYRAAPSWHVTGIVRDSRTREPVPWAVVEDDPSGQPPFYRAEADKFGAFDLLTLAEPHRIRVSAMGFHSKTIQVGRVWFLWVPGGQERRDVEISAE
jgi:hypothetical protein